MYKLSGVRFTNPVTGNDVGIGYQIVSNIVGYWFSLISKRRVLVEITTTPVIVDLQVTFVLLTFFSLLSEILLVARVVAVRRWGGLLE